MHNCHVAISQAFATVMLESSAAVAGLSSEESEARSSTTAPISLLDRLWAPLPSELSRKRKIDTNPPPNGKRRSSARGDCDPKSVSPGQRVSEFPGELTVSTNHLFCKACQVCLGLKRSIVLNHIKTVKHNESKRLLLKNEREMDIPVAMKKHDEESHCKGETLLEEHRIYRARAVMTFLRAGVPLAKLKYFL